jgi:hypothetical protein
VFTRNNFPKHKLKLDIYHDYSRGYLTFPDNTQDNGVANDAFAYLGLLAPCLSDEHSDVLTGREPPQDTPDFNTLIASLWNNDVNSPSCYGNSHTISALATIERLVLGGEPEPKSYRKAIDPNNPERDFWIAAIDREIKTLEDKGTWTKVKLDSSKRPRVNGKNTIRCKFVFKKKLNKDGSLQYKARLVACGYSQIAGEDFSSDEIYASVCSYSSMRLLMAIATQKNYLLYQTDITGAYLEPEIR